MTEIGSSAVRRRPRFQRAGTAPTFHITERDITIVREVARHRFLRSVHISQLLDAPHKKILERLTLLYRSGYLDRPRSQIDYHVRGGGREPLVYALGNRGTGFLASREGFDGARLDWSSKNAQAGREFLLHTLAVADFRIALRVAGRKRGMIDIRDGSELLAGLPEAGRAAPKPWAWRVRVHHGGSTHEIGVVPDHVFALVYPDGRRRAFMVECDRGTMPVERSSLEQTSMLRKFLAYEATCQQQVHTRRFGWKAFRCLVVTASQERAANMRGTISRTPQLAGTPLFLFADHNALLQSDVLGASWSDAEGKRHSLI